MCLSIKLFDCKIDHIGTASHVYFDEGMNDLPFNTILPNQRELERVEQGDKFPVELNKINTYNEFHFYVYHSFKIGEDIGNQAQIYQSYFWSQTCKR